MLYKKILVGFHHHDQMQFNKNRLSFRASIISSNRCVFFNIHDIIYALWCFIVKFNLLAVKYNLDLSFPIISKSRCFFVSQNIIVNKLRFYRIPLLKPACIKTQNYTRGACTYIDLSNVIRKML